MIYLIIGVFLGGCFMSIPLVYQKKELRNIKEGIRIILDDDNPRKIDLQLVNNEIEELGVEINRLIQSWKDCEKSKVLLKDEFNSSIANMSHDLRTPLTSIKGYMQFINGEELTDQEKKEYLKVCVERVNYLQKLLDDFYQLSLIDLQDKKPHLQKINLSEQLRELILSKYADFMDRGIEPEINIEDDVFVIADIGHTERIVENILANAIKYSNGDITISLEKGKVARVRISNTVENMCKEEVDKVFNRFYMVDKSRTDKGTGLGLAIAKGLVEKNNGCISAELVGNIFNIIIELKVLHF